ncbi:SRPBCC domain-containing protein [Caenibius sp. WL]|uniref:SRPBCC family protein n=1 Tax=Caenibius sp. WL TaxID=2872646 RepID=UPI001C99D77E|nr:SRPBCC domain-containing protein [Caenibius sp. WL]
MSTPAIASAIVIERTYKAAPEELWALWTTREGFESWWGPEQFRADVHRIEARQGGALHYDMVADTPAMVAMMKDIGEPASTACKGTFSEFRPHERLVLTQIIDFLPGVQPYDSRIEVDFIPASSGHTRMVVTLSQMHDAQTTQMQREGFTSQLSKLDRRYHWQGE